MAEVIEVKKPFAKKVNDLEVFRRSYSVSLQIHKATLSFPKIEQYALADQMRRASKSICANLAEGFDKQSVSKAEFKRFVSIALGSSAEMQVWLDYASILQYTKADETDRWRIAYDH